MELWGHGNVGDELIRRGAEQLYSFFEISPSAEAKSADAIFYGGGGNMGPLYPNTRRTRLHARSLADEQGIPIIVLPQSWTGPEEFEAAQLFVRERWSLEFCPSAILAPDLALAYRPPINVPDPVYDVGWFMREDAESNDRVRHGVCTDPARIARSADEYVLLAASFSLTHTDRLHFAIAAMTAGRSVFLRSNAYHKNEAMFHLWLCGRGCEWGGAVESSDKR